MNAKMYNGNIQPNHKEYKIWVNDEGIIKTWNGTKWVEQIGTGDDNGGGETSKPRWTGHADVEGLKAIGWTDEDIAYYQENGVNWNEEDDKYHKVPEDNIALYGVLTTDNISAYTNIIVYLPKIDTSSVTNMNSMFENCFSLVSIPILDTSSALTMNGIFHNCYALTSIPILDTSNVTNMSNMFNNCSSLTSVPPLDTSSALVMSNMFCNCFSLVSIPILDTSNVTSMGYMFEKCFSLTSIPLLDTSNVTSMTNMFNKCYSSQTLNLNGLKVALMIYNASLLTKDSLLYIINNDEATSAITITLSSYCYTKYAEDADVVEALSNHPNISLAQG